MLQLIGFSSEDLNIFFQTKKPHGLDLDHRIPQSPHFFLLWPHAEPGMKQVHPPYTYTVEMRLEEKWCPEGQENSMTKGNEKG